MVHVLKNMNINAPYQKKFIRKEKDSTVMYGISQRTGAFASSFGKAKVLTCSAYCFIKCVLVQRCDTNKK